VKSRVRIGYQADFPPFMFQQDGPAGLVIDALASAVVDLGEAGAEIAWMALALDHQQQALIDGEVDLLAGLGVTPDRARDVVFGEALVRTGGALFRRQGASSLERIVTPRSGPLHEPTGAAFPECELLDATDYKHALDQVRAGRADAAALNIHVGAVLAERDYPGLVDLPNEPFAIVELAPAYAPDHDIELRRLIDNRSGRHRGDHAELEGPEARSARCPSSLSIINNP